MAKKTLNEAVVRRFQRLANVAPINEMYHKRDDEEMMEADEPVMDAEMGADEPMDAEMPEEEPADMDGDLELSDEEAQAIIDLGAKLEAAMGGDMEMGGEEAPEMDMGDEEEDVGEEELMEALRGISYQPSQTEIVNEVAKRVAKRLQSAKLHEAKLNRALGKKKVNESREGDYKPALDHLNKERGVAAFALQKAAGDTTQAAQLCFAAHQMLTGKAFLPHMRDEAIAGLMKDAGLSESKGNTKRR